MAAVYSVELDEAARTDIVAAGPYRRPTPANRLLLVQFPGHDRPVISAEPGDVTLVNYPQYQAVNPPDRLAIHFNGSNQYATVPHDAALTFVSADPYSIVLWIATRNTVGGYPIAK